MGRRADSAPGHAVPAPTLGAGTAFLCDACTDPYVEYPPFAGGILPLPTCSAMIKLLLCNKEQGGNYGHR